VRSAERASYSSGRALRHWRRPLVVLDRAVGFELRMLLAIGVVVLVGAGGDDRPPAYELVVCVDVGFAESGEVVTGRQTIASVSR
jgi:hypothetical protein